MTTTDFTNCLVIKTPCIYDKDLKDMSGHLFKVRNSESSKKLWFFSFLILVFMFSKSSSRLVKLLSWLISSLISNLFNLY